VINLVLQSAKFNNQHLWHPLTNVAEKERKIPSLPKYAAVPREVFRAGPVVVEVAP
jgi:hypothetical protein